MSKYPKILTFLFSSLIFSLSGVLHAVSPVWTFKPLTPTTISVPGNSIASIQYLVTNQSLKSHTLVMKPIKGITQITTGTGICSNPFTLASRGDACTLSLEVQGNQSIPIRKGPIVCDKFGSNLQCYQPSLIDSLRVSFKKLKSIAIEPTSPYLDVGQTLNFSAIDRYSDGSTQTLSTVIWGSSNPSIASINSNGLAVGLSTLTPSESTITAAFDGVSGQTQLMIPPTPSQYVVVDLNSPTAKLTPFGGESASLTNVDVPDGGPGGVVAKLIKHTGSEVWTGTTMSTGPDDSIPRIPFSNTNTVITVQLYVKYMNEPILLKVENKSNRFISVETSTTSQASGWQTLSFNFANSSPGTPALDINQIYNKIVIFPNFGAGGNDETYYIGPSIFIGQSQPG